MLTRRAFASRVLALVAPVSQDEPQGVHLVDVTLGGPDTEGGYFEAVNAAGKGDRELILATPVDGPLYPLLKQLVGRKVQISVFTP